MKKLSRRNYIKKTALSAGSILAITSGISKAESCFLTPQQTSGPFYPEVDQKDKDRDLTNIQGSTEKALGEVVILKGVVQNESCTPIKGALVEIWQACKTGKYNHSGDPNTAELDRNFQYWGRATTNEKGEYSFKTIIPGEYKATRDWTRPPHIHLKAHLRGFRELTTQVYFKGNNLNKDDRILQGLTATQRENVIVDFQANNTGSGIKVGTFNITMNEIM